MVDENNYCSCTTPEITIKLNKQGPQGLVGPQGNPGFSPVITVEEDTSTNYKLNIQTEQGSFITPNLKGSIPAGGSAGSVLTRTESGEAEFAPIPYATTSTSGIVVFATQEDIEEGETGLAVNSSTMSNYYTKTQSDGKYVDLTSDQDIDGKKVFSDLRTSSVAEPGGNSYISYHRDGVDSNLNSVTIGGTNTPNVYINRGGLIGTNIDSNNIGSYALTSLPIASTSTLGGVKVDGTTITIDASGVISGASTYVLPTASTNTLGGVKIDGTTITIDNNGVISSQGGGSSYTAGDGIDITNDTISAKLGSPSALAISSVDGGLYVDVDESTIQINPFGKLSVSSSIVTTNTYQEITGSKTFKQGITLNVGNLTSAENIFLLSSYMCSRINTSYGWENTIALGRMIVYRHPFQNEQGILEIGSTGATTYNDTPYYYAGKLRLVAPEILTRYDGTNEYEVLDENNITTNTTIAGLTSRISTLEDTITTLQNRILALETAINGGNA